MGATTMCLVFGCKRPVKAKGLCDPHWKEERTHGRLGPAREAELPKRNLAGIYVRVTRERARELAAQAKRLGFPSSYRLASRILEEWCPPGRRPAAARVGGKTARKPPR